MSMSMYEREGEGKGEGRGREGEDLGGQTVLAEQHGTLCWLGMNVDEIMRLVVTIHDSDYDILARELAT